MLCLKLKLVLDLMNLQIATESGNTILPQNLRSSIIAQNDDLLAGKDHERLIQRLIQQIKKLATVVEKVNSHFWKAFQEPKKHFKAMPISVENGSLGEMQIALQCTYAAFYETPGAIEFVMDIVEEMWAILRKHQTSLADMPLHRRVEQTLTDKPQGDDQVSDLALRCLTYADRLTNRTKHGHYNLPIVLTISYTFVQFIIMCL